MLAGPKGTEVTHLFASAPEWHAFRDAFYALVLDARSARSEERSRGLVAALARLAPADPAATMVAGWVFEAGSEVGRHVVSKSIVDDSRDEALAAVGRALERSGAASLVSRSAFHRSITVSIEPGPGAAGAHEDVFASFVAGLLCGALGESFNCRVLVDHVKPWTFEIRLGEGRTRGGIA